MNNMDKDLSSIQEARNLAARGKIAANKIAHYKEEEIDRILCNIVRKVEENALRLAEMAVEETGFGKVKDKAYKNHMASTIVYESMKDIKTIGVIEEKEDIISVASPMGLVMGILPSTNPTSTAIYKSLIAIKSRNAIIYSPHPGALKSTREAIRIIHEAAVEAGAPENIITCLSNLSMGATNELMKHKDVAMIIATGGPGMVKASYSSGKPALGVGAGNSPSYIESTANVKEAVRKIIESKTFDNGVICSSEQSIIVEKSNREEVLLELKKQNAYFMTKEETKKLSSLLFKNNGHVMDAKSVGKSPQYMAEAAGISIPDNTKILIGEQEGVGPEYPLSYEKLTTVLAFYTVNDSDEAFDLSMKLIQHGLGHTMNIHTENKDIVMKFSDIPASRILVNAKGSQGGTGGSSLLMPAFTLGCGTWGGSSISANVGPEHLINIKKIAYGREEAPKSTFHKPDYSKISPSSFSEEKNYEEKGKIDIESNDKILKLMEDFISSMKGDN